MHTVYGQCPFGIAHTLWARRYARRQSCLPRTPPSRRVPGCGAEDLECDDSNEFALSAVARRGSPAGTRTRRRRGHADLTAGRQPNRQMRARGKGALSGRTGRLGSISCPGSVREGSGVSVSQPVSQRPEMRSVGATVSAGPARASASDSALRQPKVRPTGDSTNAFVKTLCPRRRQPRGPQP